MTAEPLPLRDLHLPTPVDWWPPAPGWWVLAALLLLALGRYLWLVLRQWRQGAPRRAALRECARLSRRYADDGDVVALAQGLSRLLRRTMLAYAPRQAVAGLVGEDWLGFLDRGLPDAPFSHGPGRNLEWLPYRNSAVATGVDARELLHTVEQRLKTPLPEERR